MNDEQLGEMYRSALAGPSPDTGRCLQPEQLKALVERLGGERERLEDLDHVMSCVTCLRDFELLRSIDKASRVASVASRRAPLAMAASIVGLLLAGSLWQLTRQPEPLFRGPATESVRVLEPIGSVFAPELIRWTAAGVDARYEVQLLGIGGEVVFSASTADTVLAFPVGTLAPDVNYRLVLVVVSLEEGRVTIPPTEFRVR